MLSPRSGFLLEQPGAVRARSQCFCEWQFNVLWQACSSESPDSVLLALVPVAVGESESHITSFFSLMLVLRAFFFFLIGLQ